MNLKKLVNKCNFGVESCLYYPEDPFGIYYKLARIWSNAYLKAGNLYGDITITKVKPYDLFKDDTNYIALHFIKWVLQEIPKTFWIYRPDFELNKKRLFDSAKKSDLREVWIDMEDHKNKLKCAKIEYVWDNLKSGFFYLPTYQQIAIEVATWGNYKYEWGQVKEQKISIQI